VYIFDHRLWSGLANWSCLTSETDEPCLNEDSNILVEGLRRVCRLADNGFGRDRMGFGVLVRVWLSLCFYRSVMGC